MAAEASVAASLPTEQIDAWQGPWRILVALASTLPYSYADAVDATVSRLRALPAGQGLPRLPRGPKVSGQVLWTSDRYGSRFAVAAPIMTADEPERWYLWDIDTCGHQALTVHSGYYLSSAAALAEWQAGVGELASAGAVLGPVDDPELLAAILPVEMGFMRIEAENAGQLAEYHRSMRLAEAVEQALPRLNGRPEAGLTADTAATEFAAWLRDQAPDQPHDLDELVKELAGSWNLNDIGTVYATCSPHRVALCMLHLRNYYLDDFADQLVSLLPDWTRWLAARNSTPQALADRCLPYAHGQPHPQLGGDDTQVDYLVRVVE